MSNACRVSLCLLPYSLYNCCATLVQLNTISGLNEAKHRCRTSISSISFKRKVIIITHFDNEILLCSKMNCQFDIYFPPACGVIWSLSKINLIATNSIRFRVINASVKRKVLVLLEKNKFSNGNCRVKPHRFLWFIYYHLAPAAMANSCTFKN